MNTQNRENFKRLTIKNTDQGKTLSLGGVEKKEGGQMVRKGELAEKTHQGP